MKTSTEVTGNLFASLTYSRTLDALLTHFFIYKPVVYRCLCQITESIQHNQFAKQPSMLASWGPHFQRHTAWSSQPAGAGACSVFGESRAGPFAVSSRGQVVLGPCSRLEVALQRFGRFPRKWQPHAWAQLRRRARRLHTHTPCSFLLPPLEPSAPLGRAASSLRALPLL